MRTIPPPVILAGFERPERSPRRPLTVPPWTAGVAFLAVAAYLVIFAWGMQSLSYDIWGALLVGPLMVLVTVAVVGRLVRSGDDPRLGAMLVAAVVLKFVAAVVLYVVSSELYGGVADAFGYHDHAVALAESFRRGDFTVELPYEFGFVGSGFAYVLTGLVEAVIGPTKLGASLAFAWISFWGLYLSYRAFCIGFPEGRRRRYAVLVFFLPSLLYWPSTIGKDAWMALTLGLTAYGVARLVTHRRGGFLAVFAGLLGSALMRPHVALLAFAALGLAYLLRRSRTMGLAEPTKLVGAAVLLVVGLLVVAQVEEFLGIDRLNPESAQKALAETSSNTSSYEGSQRDAGVPSLVTLPSAVVTVLFRPFPHEARNVQALVAASEGVLLLLLFAASARALLTLPRHVLRVPYVAYAVAFTLMFSFAFSSFGNFGLLARERVQVFPLALVVLALPPASPSRRSPPSWAPAHAPATVEGGPDSHPSSGL